MRLTFALFMLMAAAGFAALGVWQVERLSWKHKLIAQTEQKIAAAPIPAPDTPEWPHIGLKDAYTKITVKGHYLAAKDTFVVASTRLGRGYWVMTPLVTEQGFTILINRGFVRPVQRNSLSIPERNVVIHGLLRLSEPKGSFLQANSPEEDRWYSRDIAAIAKHQELNHVAPYFIDAEAAPDGNVPVGGLTVINFPNNHLHYAVTWFGLMLLALAGGLFILFQERITRLRENLLS